MWSFFSRDPAKDFPYDIGEKLTGLEDKSIWTLHQGKKKATGDPVSIFAFDVKAGSETLLQTAKTSLKRIKTLRHPNILTFLDGVETDKVIYFATEPVIPLETYLRDHDSEGHNEIAISWGLHQVVKGLSFLVNDCNLIHNNVCMSSIFVDTAGEWKLAGVDYMYPSQGPDSIPPVKILPLLERYDSPEKVEGKKIKAEKWAADMWGLGCLIWEVFNGYLPRTMALKSPGKIPQALIPNYCELVGANPRSRPNPAKLIEKCRQQGGFMHNTFVDSMLFLEEIQIKEQTEKNQFFSSLTPSLDSFPTAFCKNKILPQLLHAFEYGNAGSSVMAPLLKIGKHLDTEEYQRKIVPCVVKLFSSPDRATRVKLLQQIENFVEHLQPGTVNDKLFPNINSGFGDTNPMVRESTIKAILHLAPKLNYKNLNEEVMRQFARLQAKDDQGGIRTNTTVCLGKIAGYINPGIRQKILSSAFMRALKDPFPPARQAGILGMATTQNFYNLSEVAMRLLPALCTMTRDPDKATRDQAFKTIKGFISKLEKVSEDPELESEYERDVTSTGSTSSAAAAAGWAGWAVTGVTSLTSKIYQKSTQQPSRVGELPAKSGTPPGKSGTPPSKSKTPPRSSGTPASEPQTNKHVTDFSVQDNQSDSTEISDAEFDMEGQPKGGGWDEEDWGDIEEFGDGKECDVKPTSNDGWEDEDDEDWGSLDTFEDLSKPRDKLSSSRGKGEEFTSTQNTGLPTTGSYNWGGDSNNDDFFSTVVASKNPRSKSNTPVRETPPRESKPNQVSNSKKTSSGWDDKNSEGENAAEKKKRERQEKQLERRKELQEKRELKEAQRSSKQKSSMETTAWENNSETASSGWADDGWGGDEWGGSKESQETAAEKQKRERAEKQQQKQKELREKREARKAGAGAMKLGVKKQTTPDFLDFS